MKEALGTPGILGTHHVGLTTGHFDDMRRFYVEVLGLPVVGGFDGHDIIFIAAGTTTIELLGEGSSLRREGDGWDHLAWEVEDVDRAYRALAARGVAFHIPPEDFPPESPAMRIAFFKDPDGNLLELVQPLGPDDSINGPSPAPGGR